MADLASSAATLYPTLSTGGGDFYPAGKDQRNIVARRLLLVLTGQGGATNKITAASLGFSQLLWCSNLWDESDSKGYPAVVDPKNNIIILLSGADPTAPVDVTAAITYITVVGAPTLAIN